MYYIVMYSCINVYILLVAPLLLINQWQNEVRNEYVLTFIDSYECIYKYVKIYVY
jgi:hypothetical protein